MAAGLDDSIDYRKCRRYAAVPGNRARKTGRGCPICGGLPAARFRPFCSARCADIDLARWLNESYRVPGEPTDPPADRGNDEPGR